MKNDDWKLPLFNKYIDSWFIGHKSTDEMQQGSANQQVILLHIKNNDWITDVFDIGMSQTIRG